MELTNTNSRTTQEQPRANARGEERYPETDVWEPPFERWMQMADDLLRQWPQASGYSRETRI